MVHEDERKWRKMEELPSSLLGRVVRRIKGERMGAAGQKPVHKGLMLSHAGSVLLSQGELCVVHLTGMCRICCVEGAVWLTSPGRFSDYILKGGESICLRGQGKIVISSGTKTSCIQLADR